MNLKNKKKRHSYLFAVIALLIFGLVGCAGTLLVLYVYPVSILTCRYEGTEQVDCKLQKRMIGIITIQEISIVNLKEAHAFKEVHQDRRWKGIREDDVVLWKMILSSNSGMVDLGSSDDLGGIFINQSIERLNDFLVTHTDEPLKIWQATWVPMLVGSLFFLVSVMMLYVAANILARGITGKIR